MNLIKNLTRPEQIPADGDYIEITHENGAIERKHYIPGVSTPSLPVYSAVEFLLVVGEDVAETFDAPKNKRQRFFKKLIDKAQVIDLNNPVYFSMLQEYFEIDHPEAWSRLKGEI